MSGALCGPDQLYRRIVRHCPVCERRRRFVVQWLGAWYGSRIQCLGCGDAWSEGEMYPRPFLRGWREKAKREARANWDAAVGPREYRRYVKVDTMLALSPRETA